MKNAEENLQGTEDLPLLQATDAQSSSPGPRSAVHRSLWGQAGWLLEGVRAHTHTHTRTRTHTGTRNAYHFIFAVTFAF